MIPTSVTTAVMLAGGVKSYKGFKISRCWPLCIDWVPGCLFGARGGKMAVGAKTDEHVISCLSDF